MKEKLLRKPLSFWHNQSGLAKVLILAGIFFTVTLSLALNRYYSFYTSFDHGLFNQLFWNSIHGHFFQGSLSSNNSSASLVDGQIPSVNYIHLGQHFVLNFVLWFPIYALFQSPVTLIVLQVGLLTAAGVVLYFLARQYLPSRIAVLIAASFYGANPVIGPAVDNFYEQCQLPLFLFGLLLAMEKRCWWLFWVLAALTLTIREDTGISLFGIGAYLLLSRRHPRTGLVLCLLSFSYVAVVTNLVMPLFSNDSSRLYLAPYFKKFVKSEDPSTLELLWGIISQPQLIIESIFQNFDRRLRYLLGQWLPLAFVPVISPAAWIMVGFPLMVLLLQVANKDAVSINTRYTLSVVPLLIYGTILWWSNQSDFRLGKIDIDWKYLSKKNIVGFWKKTSDSQIQTPKSLSPRFRRFWIGCIVFSLFFTVTSNPHRSLYFITPFSIKPWVYVSLNHRWNHGEELKTVMKLIPPDASVATSAYVVPHISSRRKIVRLPFLQVRDEQDKIVDIDFALVDLWQLKQPKLSAIVDRVRLMDTVPVIERVLLQGTYGVIEVRDDIILLKKGASSNPQAISAWLKLREELRPILQP